jgi:TRAP-type C4-dicarboxylate transport system permease small subunit
MHQTVQRAAHLFSRIFAHGASFSMIILFLIVFINSVRRYTVGKSLEWGEQLPVFVTIYGVMFGIAWAYLQDKHIRFTILVGFLPETMTQKLYMFVDLIMAATSILLAYSGWLFVIKRGGLEASGLINLAKELRNLSGWDAAIWIGHLYPYQAAMMIGGGMLFTAATLRFLLRFSDETSPETAGE